MHHMCERTIAEYLIDVSGIFGRNHYIFAAKMVWREQSYPFCWTAVSNPFYLTAGVLHESVQVVPSSL
jgi:hypothetical protein